MSLVFIEEVRRYESNSRKSKKIAIENTTGIRY
jgi:hypothetical protein